MSVICKGWREEGKTWIPTLIERRWCPSDDGHWRVDDDRCPVCNAKVQVSRYELVKGERVHA